MCKFDITEQVGHNYNGVLFPSRFLAVQAALKDLGTTLIKEHSTDMSSGLKHYSKSLRSLLNEFEELAAQPVGLDEGSVDEAQ